MDEGVELCRDMDVNGRESKTNRVQQSKCSVCIILSMESSMQILDFCC
jgi:hypothetical protein